MADLNGERVVVIGAGFAGMAAAHELGRAGTRVTLLDRRNHQVFKPLLYQVATASLSPEDIATPIRQAMSRHRSVDVLMDGVAGIDRVARCVRLRSGAVLEYSHLVVATGAQDNYFGNADWVRRAPGLKSLEDAVALRSRVLAAFERAETSRNADERARLMTFVVVGGGPTGVEVAGAIAALSRRTLRGEFRAIRPDMTRIILIEAGERLLAGFDPALSAYARERLERAGVTVRLGAPVEAVGMDGITCAGEEIASETVVWAAGVEASPVGRMLESELDAGGRVHVTASLNLPGDERVFVLGDLAHCPDEEGAPLPGLAQVARQQGRHLGRHLPALLREGMAIPQFRYRSRGNTAIFGKAEAVFETRRLRWSGWPAWMIWVVAHVYLLAGFQNRVLVMLQWMWRSVTGERSSRIILDWRRTDHPEPDGTPRPDRGRGA